MAEEKEWNWDDDTSDDNFCPKPVESVKESSQITHLKRKLRKKKKIVKKVDPSEEEDSGIEYPVAVWFAISEYISPEDVGRFAGICRETFFVTTFAKFWHNLYKKYCQPFKENLPENLKPENMRRRYGLRTLVIRSLYHTYFPFVKRRSDIKYTQLQTIERCKCTHMWHQKYKNQWIFYFKMRINRGYKSRAIELSESNSNLLALYDDIYANPDENFKVLRVLCSGFSEASSIMGKYLQTIQTSLGGGMSCYNLKMCFSPGIVNNCDSIVLLEKVTKIKVEDWWHATYPHSTQNFPSYTNSIYLNGFLDALKL